MARTIETKYFEDRVETGALRIGNDWKGLFIRGDDCIQMMGVLDMVLDGEKLQVWDINYLKSIRDCIVGEVLNWEK